MVSGRAGIYYLWVHALKEVRFEIVERFSVQKFSRDLQLCRCVTEQLF